MSDPKNPPAEANAPIDRLLQIMARLRDPNGGCPWDLEQSFATIVPHTIEEAYEVAEAIEQGDMEALRGELGDLLFQVVFYAQLGREAGVFDFGSIVKSLNNKMIERHPHVFSDAKIDSANAQTEAWETQKARERARAAQQNGAVASALDGVTSGLPALTRAAKLQKRAARIGFDWPGAAPVIDKIREEIDELQAELGATGPAGKERIAEELGDLLFACANLARHLDLDSETVLRAANRKFERRFRRIEALLTEAGAKPGESHSLDKLDALWDRAKAEEKAGG